MAAVWEETHTHNLRHKTPSFSSSLLDAISRSIDDKDAAPHARKNAAQDIESLRRAIMIEKWISNTQPSHHFPSSAPDIMTTRAPKREGRLFTKANKTKAAKEPVSPGGKIASFFNSIFSPRNLKPNEALEMRKSRSMKDAVKTSRSCLTKNVSCGGSKSKRSVRFWLVDEDCQQKSNSRNLGALEGGRRKGEDLDLDLDGMSCGSSDLFELDNIGREEELPVYGTTDLQI